MQESSTAAVKPHRKSPYFLGIAAATLGFVLSLIEPKIHGPKLWAISACAIVAVLVSVLKLQNLRRGIGWVFPGTNALLLAAVVVEVWLHLWFSH
jgi:hypothetical protein